MSVGQTWWRRATALLALVVVTAACTVPDPPQVTPEPPGADGQDEPDVMPPDGEPDVRPDGEEPPEAALPEPDEPPEQHRAAALPIPRTEVTGTAWGGRIVAIGGLDAGGAALAAVHVYDPDADRWEEAPPLPVALHHTAVATLDERVYVVGGYAIRDGAWVPERAVWSLGEGETSWREEPPLSTPRGALAVASTGRRLVALGGVGPGREVLASSEVLEAGADAWAPGPDLDTAREHLDATAVGDVVFAIAGRAGGFDTNHSSVEVLRDEQWVPTAPLQHARGGIGAATVEGVPCVAGGEEPAGTIGTIECLLGDAWEVVGELEVARHGLVVAGLGGELHVVGGGPEPGLTVSDVHEVVPLALP